jgi:hypothetical protein
MYRQRATWSGEGERPELDEHEHVATGDKPAVDFAAEVQQAGVVAEGSAHGQDVPRLRGPCRGQQSAEPGLHQLSRVF